jgi:hypothetical protein
MTTERAEMRPRRVGALASVEETAPRQRRAQPTVQMTLRASEEILDKFRTLSDDLRYTHGQMLEQLMSRAFMRAQSRSRGSKHSRARSGARQTRCWRGS